MIKFAQRLHTILNQKIDDEEQRSKDLQQWNEDIEKILFADPKEQRKQQESKEGEETAVNEDQAKQLVDTISQKLQQDLVLTVAKALGVSDSQEDQLLQAVVNHCQDHNTETINVAIADASSWKYLEDLVQTSGNFLRWYLQVYLQRYPLVYPMASKPFQSKDMLTLILFLIEYNAKLEDNNDNNNNSATSENVAALIPAQRFARFASLLLFYSTFSPRSPNDEDMQQTHDRLVNELKFIPKVLGLLTYPSQTSAPLALSLIRNIHNLLASFSGAIQAVQTTGFKYDDTTSTPKAPWNPKPDDNTDGLITFPSIFRDVLIWSLSATPPPFPGPPQDKRPELVVEILGIIFAMGGTEVSRALRYPCPNAALSQLVITSLHFPEPQNDSRIYQVKLSTITILTDANPSFGTFIVEQSALPALIQIAERQIDTVIDNTQVDETAVSALVPSLAVLYKFSAGNPTFREATKELIFPPSQEDLFWKLAQDQLSATNNDDNDNDNQEEPATVPAAKNMHPLDAPRGTLRWKLIHLMTWTESHIKRYASELLWALCEEDPKEFVLRTGLGNAMGFLGGKGLVQLPPHALE